VDRGKGLGGGAWKALSVIIPVLDDDDAAARLLAQIPQDPEIEVIIVDGGGSPGLEQIVGSRPGTRLLHSLAGRARQMNAGARAAGREWLLFLHADSTLAPGWRHAFERISPNAVGGWFRFALDDDAWQARVIERLVAWRVRTVRLPYGDQGLFVRRDVFDTLGGYREWPLLEDVEFVRRLARAGAVAELPLPLRTSARRWRRDGWFRRSAGNSLIVALYFAGVPAPLLARWYGLALRE
jgi:rSAM/selenodomain-associated transferase 2